MDYDNVHETDALNVTPNQSTNNPSHDSMRMSSQRDTLLDEHNKTGGTAVDNSLSHSRKSER